ncbi:hypothetical protein NDU88_004536 [Pleurodeles waltl]|uniref:Uncharacterized protein n=1 Tax=Pleurodeles waltl TaxID=8319 RepID=A0AAV7QG57_PLEWA|nr:hypothetical protein NDU88_004536 [Pleurodeles waltl]
MGCSAALGCGDLKADGKQDKPGGRGPERDCGSARGPSAEWGKWGPRELQAQPHEEGLLQPLHPPFIPEQDPPNRRPRDIGEGCRRLEKTPEQKPANSERQPGG